MGMERGQRVSEPPAGPRPPQRSDPAAVAASLLRRARAGRAVTTADVLAAVPCPDEVSAEDYRASVDALGELGAKTLSAEHTTALPVPRPSDDDAPADDSLRLYLREISAYPLLSPAEEVELAKRIEAGDRAAFERMVVSNLKLAASAAFRASRWSGLSTLDLIQEANAGLMKAVEKFDWRRGFRFSTYAMYWIQQSLQHATAEQGRTIRVPLHAADRLRRIRRAEARLTQALGREPTPEEVAAAIDASPRTVRDALRGAPDTVSLQAPLGTGDDDDRSLADTQADPQSPSPEELLVGLAAREHLASRVRALVSRFLSQPEQAVIRVRYGLGDAERAAKELERLGVTPERMRELERRALGRLRAAWVIASLREDLLELGLSWRSRWLSYSIRYAGNAATIRLRITVPGGAPRQVVRVVAVGPDGTTVTDSQEVHPSGRRVAQRITGPVPMTVQVFINGSVMQRIEASGRAASTPSASRAAPAPSTTNGHAPDRSRA
jgi:RNA polymerase primary sigma factor